MEREGVIMSMKPKHEELWDWGGVSVGQIMLYMCEDLGLNPQYLCRKSDVVVWVSIMQGRQRFSGPC